MVVTFVLFGKAKAADAAGWVPTLNIIIEGQDVPDVWTNKIYRFDTKKECEDFQDGVRDRMKGIVDLTYRALDKKVTEIQPSCVLKVPELDI